MATWKGVEEASRRKKGGGPSTADPAFVCFRFRSSRMRIKDDTATWNVLLPPPPPLDDSPMLFRLISVKIVIDVIDAWCKDQFLNSLEFFVRRILKKNFEKDEKEGRVLAKEKW